MTSPSTPTRRGTALTRARVVEAALDLAREEGLDGVTMRALARSLGVGTMTLYGYFRGKDELVDAMVDTVTAEAGIAVGRGPWHEQLRTLVRGIRGALERHPVGVEIRRRRPILSPAALAVTEVGLQILERAGFSRAEAARAYRSLWLYAFGFAAFNAPADPQEVKRHARSALGALSPEEYPALSAAAAEAAETMAGDDQFEFGLELILTGLRSRLD